jgi:tetratricopeptide (TPR) repeat protein
MTVGWNIFRRVPHHLEALRMLRLSYLLFVLFCAAFISSPLALGDNKGLDKLDEATIKKLDAESPADLAAVIELCEEAMKLGLDEENTALAKQILSGAALQRAQAMIQQLPAVANNQAALRRLRRETLKDLEKAVANDPMLADALILMARLETLPGGSREKSLEHVNKAIEALADKPLDQAKVYIMRAGLQETNEAKLSDLNKAIAIDPTNGDAIQAKIALFFMMDNLEGAFAEADKILEEDATNLFAFEAAIRSLIGLQKFDKAVELLTKRIEKDESNGNLYRIRATIYDELDKQDQALADLNKAIELNFRDYEALVMRGRIYYLRNEVDKANRDISDALLIEPNSVQGVLMRSLVAANERRYADAIADMEMLVRADPSNAGWIMQLAALYQADERPRLAIRLLDELVRKDAAAWRALRLRGDAKLSISEHASAIKDYEAALKQLEAIQESTDVDEDYSGLLNNLSWVLSTTTQDNLRDGPRSLELALKASEATEYKQPHILSTLAAAYAETGDFDKAREWAAKAVELAEAESNPQLDQLKEELESYRENKPWREEQKTLENEKQLKAAGDTIDT